MKDHKGFLWAGTWSGALYRLSPGGRVERYAGAHGLPRVEGGAVRVQTLLEDRAGNIWVGTRGTGLHRLVAEPAPARALVARTYSAKDGLPSGWINAVRQTRDGRIWVATAGEGLCSFAPSSPGSDPTFRIHGAKNGICEYGAADLAEDHNGNLWVASPCGATRIVRNGFTGYGLADGLATPYVNSIFESRDGDLIVINAPELARDIGRQVNRFDGERFTSVAPNLPSSINYHGWGWGQTITQDHLGEWWIPTGTGLYRFPNVKRVEQLASVKPKGVYDVRSGVPEGEVFRVYEDSRGDIWLATSARMGLLKWERATETLRDYTQESGLPPDVNVTAFREDRAGNLWIGTAEAGLLRYREGKFKRFTVEDGAPPGWITWLYTDGAGRLWVGSQISGLNRIDDPGADVLRAIRYTTLDGLSSNNIRTITEDSSGRVYVGTGHGVDRLEPASRMLKHFTVGDGLPKGTIETAFRDRNGALWFGSQFGLSRFVPETQRSNIAPSVYITGLRVAGVARRIAELGQVTLPALDLASDHNQVSLDFAGIGASISDELRYEYRLEGGGGAWGPPTTERTVSYANLSPGTYRFLVRAVTPEGLTSPMSATVAFEIATPLWRRWWVLALGALVVGSIAYLLYRYRVNRILEIAAMRTRIATDLHDDIGSSLSQIAIMSEVIRRQVEDEKRRVSRPLSVIASTSRELVDSMSDIVWATNPARDHLIDLTQRMRRFAGDLLTARNLEFTFAAPGLESDTQIESDVRREVFLIFKEGINNAVRHSGCSSIEVGFAVADNRLTLRVADDGCSFDPAQATGGHGLASMKRRAESIGGTLDILAAAGQGTAITLQAPFHRRRRGRIRMPT